MNNQFTPGPWKLSGTGIWAPCKGMESARVVAKACETEPDSTVIVYKDAEIGSKNLNEVFANARLIAASPDLLEACKATLVDLRVARLLSEKGFTETIKRLEAAIQKAEGNQ